MAMKVIKTAIHRLSVDMSCGCKLYAEFKDAQCKEALTEGEVERTFVACATHKADPSLSMLMFLIGERLDEAVEEAQKAPVVPVHLHPIPQGIEVGDTGGVLAASTSTVQSVMKVNRPEAVGRARERGVKTMQRTPEQLVNSGAVVPGLKTKVAVRGDGGVQMAAEGDVQIYEADEDEAVTPHIDELMAILDPKDGLVLDEEE